MRPKGVIKNYLFKNSALGLFFKIIKIDFKIIYIFILINNGISNI